MTRKDPSEFNWNDLRYFLMVVRAGNPTRAARMLEVDHTTVRRRVQTLERDLNVFLFDRNDERHILTPEGERLLSRVESIENIVIAARDELFGDREQLSGTVRISVPDGFGSFYLAPRLAQFREAHPRLNIELAATSRHFSVSKRETDIAIVLSRPADSRHIMRKLVNCRSMLYASPKYLAVMPRITCVDDLHGHRFIGYSDHMDFNPELDPRSPIYEELAHAEFTSTNLIAQYKATVAGGGLCLLPPFMLEPEHPLVAVLPNEVSLVREHWMVVHQELHPIVRFRTVCNFIVRQIQRDQHLFDILAAPMGDSTEPADHVAIIP
jgi:DNA-binding transcriptional LysR family regulator